MISQLEKAKQFKNLHVKGTPLILFNTWDTGSALAVQEIGAKAIATSSWAVAAAHGYEDGEKLPFNKVLSNLKQITSRVNLPVTIDLEGGYGITVSDVQKTIKVIIEAGAIGINFEDQIIGGEGLYSIEEQCRRIEGIKKIANDTSIPLFINARTDIFFKTDPSTHNELHCKEAIARAIAYAKAGANGFFVPGLLKFEYIEKLCNFSPIPINIMVSDTTLFKELSTFGVARISYGPTPYLTAINKLKETGRLAFTTN